MKTYGMRSFNCVSDLWWFPFLVLLSGALLAGCSKRDAAPGNSSGTKAEHLSTKLSSFETSGGEARAVAPGSAVPSVLAPQRKANPTDTELDLLLKAVDEDSDFACERAYVQTKNAIDHNPPTIDGKLVANLDFTKETFLRDCHRMPAAVQKCLVFEYAFKRSAYCKEERREYDARNQKQLLR